jgi:hypothetical protein
MRRMFSKVSDRDAMAAAEGMLPAGAGRARERRRASAILETERMRGVRRGVSRLATKCQVSLSCWCLVSHFCQVCQGVIWWSHRGRWQGVCQSRTRGTLALRSRV